MGRHDRVFHARASAGRYQGAAGWGSPSWSRPRSPTRRRRPSSWPRARIVATADETRRRIERDLHDGAQQRLVSLALQLRAAQAAVPAGLGELAAELGDVSAGLTSTLDELREYDRGIHPAILAERGLGPALKALARRSPVPEILDVRTEARLPERIEVTEYYVVSEALANAAKHASASAICVDVGLAGGAVWLAARDDGTGRADPAWLVSKIALKPSAER